MTNGIGGREMGKMRAAVFHGVDDIRVEEVERPCAGVGEADAYLLARRNQGCV
jgi:hypothetical protein